MPENFEQPKPVSPEQTSQEKIDKVISSLSQKTIPIITEADKEQILSDPRIKDAVKEYIIHMDHTNTIVRLFELKRNFLLYQQDDEISELIVGQAIGVVLYDEKELSEGERQYFERYRIDMLSLADDLGIQRDKFTKAAEKNIEYTADLGWTDNIEKYGRAVGFDDEHIRDIVSNALIKDTFSDPDTLNFLGVCNSVIHWKLSEKISLDDTKAYDEKMTGLEDFVATSYIEIIGSKDLQLIFPKALKKIREIIFDKLNKDLDTADYFIENLDKYYQEPWVAEYVAVAVSHYSVAKKFKLASKKSEAIWKDEPWVSEVLKKVNKIVTNHEFSGGEGFSQTDPYENHPWRFTAKQARLSTTVAKALDGNIEAIKEIRSAGFNLESDGHILSEINNKITDIYTGFLEEVKNNINIKDDDKESLLNPKEGEVKLTLLIDNVRAFVARYLVQKIDGDFSKFFPNNMLADIEPIIEEGFKRYTKALEVDVPLYDKLYEEFDNLRETGRNPLEVYLGRDGIYAWIGRRSQDIARRRKIGLGGGKKLREMGEVIVIHPQYTIYPRYFRDNLNYETKRKFLEQEGISPDADPLFYDTGYVGTIPEQIMKVMDFSDEEIEKRIKLLSAPHAHRRVKGIAENARHEIVEYIEHNAKTEEAAEGLILDEKTGKIRHVAKPTSPEEQFNFMMVKQAISRHYWLQEKLHHEPSGNVNLDSEHYTIRIRQEYAKLLPSEFMQNPKEFLTQHGELLKGSKGEGEFPDEEIILFKMTDGTEIVAKKIELRKAKEARKEFSILISAKKAGLPTAEPVGFLSGKEDIDGSYLLMKKIEGISGRNFDKYLRDSGKFTEEKIKSILQQVAQKNKEMAELFRTKLKIDKRWRIKDTIIELNEETGEVENVIPIDWERAQNFNPATPKEIDEIA